MMTGLLCAGPRSGAKWSAVVLGEAVSEKDAPELYEMLAALYEQTALWLHEADPEFDLLLPGDEYPLTERADALGDWARGFIHGLLAGGVTDPAALPGEAGEFINDMLKILDVEVSETDTIETQEKALVELVEYIRAGVQLVYEELHPACPRTVH